jgi:hypothetical protein
MEDKHLIDIKVILETTTGFKRTMMLRKRGLTEAGARELVRKAEYPNGENPVPVKPAKAKKPKK